MGWLFGHKHKYYPIETVKRENHTDIYYGCETCDHIKMEHRRGQWTLKQIKCASHWYESVSVFFDAMEDITFVKYVCSRCEHKMQGLEIGSWTLEQIRHKKPSKANGSTNKGDGRMINLIKSLFQRKQQRLPTVREFFASNKLQTGDFLQYWDGSRSMVGKIKGNYILN